MDVFSAFENKNEYKTVFRCVAEQKNETASTGNNGND